MDTTQIVGPSEPQQIVVRINDIRFSDRPVEPPLAGFDTDGDGAVDLVDNQPEDPTVTMDTDGDEIDNGRYVDATMP